MGDFTHPLGSFENPYPQDHPPPPSSVYNDTSSTAPGSFVNPLPRDHPLPPPVFDDTIPQRIRDLVMSQQSSEATQAAPGTPTSTRPTRRNKRPHTSASPPPRRSPSPPPPYHATPPPPSFGPPTATNLSPGTLFYFTYPLTGVTFQTFNQETPASLLIRSPPPPNHQPPSQHQRTTDRRRLNTAAARQTPAALPRCIEQETLMIYSPHGEPIISHSSTALAGFFHSNPSTPPPSSSRGNTRSPRQSPRGYRRDEYDDDARSCLSVTVPPSHYRPNEGWVTRPSSRARTRGRGRGEEAGYGDSDDESDEDYVNSDEWAELESSNGQALGPEMRGALR